MLSILGLDRFVAYLATCASKRVRRLLNAVVGGFRIDLARSWAEMSRNAIVSLPIPSGAR